MGITITKVRPSGQIKASPPLGFKQDGSYPQEAIDTSPWHAVNFPVGFRYWRWATTGIGSGNTGTSLGEIKMTYGGVSHFLTAFTFTNIGGVLSGQGSSNISTVHDGIANTGNGSFIFVDDLAGVMDFYVDFGAGNEKDVTAYDLAPQGIGLGSPGFNTPTNFTAFKSNDATNWTVVKVFDPIGIQLTTGQFKSFDLTT